MPNDPLSLSVADARDAAHALLGRLKLRHLRLILALSEAHTAAAVAERLHVSPAAVSKALAEIEDIVETVAADAGGRMFASVAQEALYRKLR